MRIVDLQPFLPGTIRSFQADDEARFYKLVDQTPVDLCAFENNWPYILQATRNEPCLYEHEGTVLYLGRKRPGLFDTPLVIVHALGAHPREETREVAIAARRCGLQTLVKNVDLRELKFWQSLGFTETTEPWSQYSRRDDNSYPQHVFNLAEVHSLQGVRRSTRLKIRKLIRVRDFRTELYRFSHAQEAHELLEKYSEYSASIKHKDEAREVDRAHRFFFYREIKQCIRLEHLEQERLLAVSFFVPRGNVLFWNAIINVNESNIMRFFCWQSLHFLLLHGLKMHYLSIQGSESEGQDQWKRCFGPVRSIEKTHLVWTS